MSWCQSLLRPRLFVYVVNVQVKSIKKKKIMLSSTLTWWDTLWSFTKFEFNWLIIGSNLYNLSVLLFHIDTSSFTWLLLKSWAKQFCGSALETKGIINQAHSSKNQSMMVTYDVPLSYWFPERKNALVR